MREISRAVRADRIFAKFAGFPRDSAFLSFAEKLILCRFLFCDDSVVSSNEVTDVLCKSVDIVGNASFERSPPTRRKDGHCRLSKSNVWKFSEFWKSVESRLKRRSWTSCEKYLILRAWKSVSSSNPVCLDDRSNYRFFNYRRNTCTISSWPRDSARLVNNWRKKSAMVAINESRFLKRCLSFHL